MSTELSQRKATTFKPLLEAGVPVTRQITALFQSADITVEDDKDSARYLLQLDKTITVEGTNHLYTALFYASREEEMFKDVTFPVTVEVGRDGKKLRPNRIIEDTATADVQPTPEPTLHVDQRIITTEDIPFGERGVVVAGSWGRITDITTSKDPNCGTIVGAWIYEIGKVSADPRKFAAHPEVEGTDPAALDLFDTQEKLSQALADKQKADTTNWQLAKTINDLKAELDVARDQLAKREAADIPSPLPTKPVEYEMAQITDINAADLQKGYLAGWQFLHFSVDHADNGLTVVVVREKPTNGQSVKQTDAALYSKPVPVTVTETPLIETVVQNLSAQTEIIAKASTGDPVRDALRTGGAPIGGAGWSSGIHFKEGK